MPSINALIENTLSLEWLLRNRETYKDYFKEKYLPDTKIKDNILYVKKCLDIIKTNVANETYRERIIFVDDEFNLVNDGEFDFTDEDSMWQEFPHDGYMIYLMWSRPYGSGNYSIEYIIDLQNVCVEKIFSSVTEGISFELAFTDFDFNSLLPKQIKSANSLLTILAGEDKNKVIFNEFLKKCL